MICTCIFSGLNGIISRTRNTRSTLAKITNSPFGWSISDRKSQSISAFPSICLREKNLKTKFCSFSDIDFSITWVRKNCIRWTLIRNQKNNFFKIWCSLELIIHTNCRETSRLPNTILKTKS